MKIQETRVPGLTEVHFGSFSDERGVFAKPFQLSEFQRHGLSTDFNECYYSISKKGVLRGMHFQLPPFEHDKLVYCTKGEVIDVVVDLRKGSPTYKAYEIFQLNEESYFGVYIPIGCAHGFFSKTNDSILNYMVNSGYSPSHDSGVKWDSIGYKWPPDAVISDRDKNFLDLDKFNSPFHYG